MASAIDIGIAAALAATAVTDIVTDRIFPIVAPQTSASPNIIVSIISEHDDILLSGHSAKYPNARVSFICRGDSATDILNLGDALKASLENISNASIAGQIATFFKTSTDVTGFADTPPIFERTIDFMIRWR